jgi:copper chaperone CopZ
MSWYQNKANFHLSRSLPLTLTNLNSAADEEKVIKTLQNLNGVHKVTTDLPTKKVLVSFNPAKVQVGTIIYVLTKLGYHCLEHNCKGCGRY